MLKGKELGAAIEAARNAKGVSKKQLADAFGVKPPSIQGWVNTGRIDKSKLMELIAYFSDTVGPDHWGIDDWLADAISTGRRPTNLIVEGEPPHSADRAQAEPARVAQTDAPQQAQRAVLLAALATPRSQEALERIARAANEGRLTEADLILLEQIASRFESGAGTAAEQPQPANGNQRLKERLRNNDPGTQR